ncbi:acyltransferase [Mucilaginibacter sp. JRF]|uniref:acyltransferase family protein n=1 Tax=Mucilaginibacter sp. JRF TaxID=2780088 RepID=UPI00187E52D3|nr:acyltransferase [Mucilaginibacter sp. JRF]MBE9584400.1 acyltransferase [Mucilaginibacter sp. JRF]
MKPHYPILDGLRGTAAILVVIFHILEVNFPPETHPMNHGYLAVDFFYLLSGFVVGYAYDDRWGGNMTVWQFLKIRFARLHPMVIFSITVGAIAFWVDPFRSSSFDISLIKLIGVTLISYTILPAPDVRGWGEIHSLNGPCWSLLQEYIANILYAVTGRKLNKPALIGLVIISGIVLIVTALYQNYLGLGWSFETFWAGPVRMVFPFFGGLLLFRMGKLIRIPMTYPLCSLLLIVLFFMPRFQLNGLYDVSCIILIFPLMVAAGAGGRVSGRWAAVCKFAGDISYPLYLIHYPFIYIYGYWISVTKPTAGQNVPIAIGLFVFFILFALAALKWYDEPVRKWLRKKLVPTRAV